MIHTNHLTCMRFLERKEKETLELQLLLIFYMNKMCLIALKRTSQRQFFFSIGQWIMNYSTALILLLPVGGSFHICSSSKHCFSLSGREKCMMNVFHIKLWLNTGICDSFGCNIIFFFKLSYKWTKTNCFASYFKVRMHFL